MIKHCPQLLSVLLLLALPSSAQVSNDAFANRTFLPDGEGFVETAFWASLENTTFEPFDPTQSFGSKYSTAGSAWWRWTAYKTGFALVREITDQVYLPFPTFAVYAGNNLPGLSIIDWYEQFSFPIGLNTPRRRFLGFKTRAGEIYSFALVGDPSSKANLQFVLTFSDSPIITDVSPGQLQNAGDAALLLVTSPSLPNGHVQWQFNSEDIPNATNSALALFNVQPAQAGQYRAIVEATNSEGVLKRTVSYSSQLAVSGETTTPSLSVRTDLATDRISAHILGQAFQSYAIDSTQDFLLWRFEGFATADPDGNAEIPLPLNSAPTAKFFRLRHLGNLRHACTINLNRINFAKEMLRLAHKRDIDAPMQPDDDIKQYLGEIPACPQGGVYTFGPFGRPPVCSLAPLGHEATFQ
ncbi:MAG TPA: immunoglobulin domain-containing protein [Verrucomicrobiae bacterium]